jgi:cell division protein FtsW
MQAQSTLRRYYSRLMQQHRQFDWIMISVVMLLMLLGLLMAYSTTYFWSYTESKDPLAIFGRQLMAAVAGVAAFTVLAIFDFGYLRRIAVPAMIGMLVLLIVVRLFGDDVFGARRSLFNGSVQPSEMAKPIVILYAAAWLASRRDELGSFRNGLLPYAVIIGLVAGLILLQPDLSTAFVVCIVAFAMFFMAGADVKQIVALVIIGAFVAGAAVTLFAHSSNRLEAFQRAFSDPLGKDADYHIRQLMLTLGGAGLFGHGIGASNQKFGLLPTPHTDSVLAVLTDEMGFVGLMFTLALFGVFAWRGITIGQRANTPFGAFIAIGVTTWVITQTAMNMLSVLSMIPFTGVPVPFLSYGGSSLVSLMLACGILVSVSRGSHVDSTEEEQQLERADMSRPGVLRKLRQRGGVAFHASTSVSRRDRRTRAARAQRAESIAEAAGDKPGAARFGQDIRFAARLKPPQRRSTFRRRD